MRVLGISGGLEAIGATTNELSHESLHDGAAVLVVDGHIVAAIEEERLDRVKHSPYAPIAAISYCLREAGLTLDAIDQLAVVGDERYIDAELESAVLSRGGGVAYGVRTLHRAILGRALGSPIEPEKIRYVPHHRAHAWSAYGASGLDASLVLTLDWQGDDVSGEVYAARGRHLERLARIAPADSLGKLYQRVTYFLGFEPFDEYKVMGLAPYGDPRAFASLFGRVCRLEDAGRVALELDALHALFTEARSRAPGNPIEDVHRDVAAALQACLEGAIVHILAHHQRTTGLRNLCFAGGVAQNCAVNGRLLERGLFDRIFVPPVANDAGCALGAAIEVARLAEPVRHAYYGPKLADGRPLVRLLDRWGSFVEHHEEHDVVAFGARALASGQVLGWCQGRSELGPRALGHRSILADPRPAENRRLINERIKNRESFRPFAPALAVGRVAEYFDVRPETAELSFMSFAVPVRERHRASLGAVTHVDGSARVQVVSREIEPRFFDLIEAFGELTGVPVLLNTSFNNEVEPVVDSAEDAIVTFLTTRLDALILGDRVVRRRPFDADQILELVISWPRHVELRRVDRPGHERRYTFVGPTGSYDVSPRLARVVEQADGRRTARELGAVAELTDELWRAWCARVVVMFPPE